MYFSIFLNLDQKKPYLSSMALDVSVSSYSLVSFFTEKSM